MRGDARGDVLQLRLGNPHIALRGCQRGAPPRSHVPRPRSTAESACSAVAFVRSSSTRAASPVLASDWERLRSCSRPLSTAVACSRSALAPGNGRLCIVDEDLGPVALRRLQCPPSAGPRPSPPARARDVSQQRWRRAVPARRRPALTELSSTRSSVSTPGAPALSATWRSGLRVPEARTVLVTGPRSMRSQCGKAGPAGGSAHAGQPRAPRPRQPPPPAPWHSFRMRYSAGPKLSVPQFTIKPCGLARPAGPRPCPLNFVHRTLQAPAGCSHLPKSWLPSPVTQNFQWISPTYCVLWR